MIDLKFLDDLTRRLSEAVPPSVSRAREDIESHFRAVLKSAFERMDLVTREEFDAQRAVLKRCQEKLEALEQAIDSSG